ncbi:Phytocyanin domain-containing protein [Heracleum sosnowskyi]|uniref:Phytocyanin domain-containing protein n=1 Tax=Heracleum sosnowskyi TaxID=360622 RepID=A0AAD8MSK6_9APIA|nr:Phytocyanin domain-containing protein [Heracleum sosnowskyi]
MAYERLNMAVFLIVIVVVTLQMQMSNAQNSHTVGDSVGWAFPPNANTYATWAASQKFAVGDTLVFKFVNQVHTVAEVTETAYKTCNTQNPISVWSSSPASVPLKSSGSHYYLCTVPDHCSAGQKLAINV